ncbi:type I secretion system permease/ATPase [Methylophilus aquaticus]|uniref:Type I secretion system permease/ATPase n=1 Tax=Methylophilus aquaticus TaxID=1971610 RepID=A0ABT9JQQ6_9PROT|nr:type I secretion system permease/ATPase [Methylophilus aquaticus]MDP8566897.1 type I secretion system permease/ATPase [Methylophilus aquaticus]
MTVSAITSTADKATPDRMPLPARAAWLALMTPFRGAFLQMAWLSMLTNVLMLVPTLYMLQLYDRVMVSRNTLTLVAVTLLTIGLLLFMALADWIRSAVAIKTGVQFDLHYGKQVFHAAFDTRPVVDRTDHKIGHQIAPAQVLQHLTAVRQFMTGAGLFAFFDMPWSVVYIMVLTILHPVLGLTAVVFCLVQWVVAVWNQRVMAAPLQHSQQARQQTDAFLQQKIRHLQTSHVMGMMHTLQQQWQQLLKQQTQSEALGLRVSDRSQCVNKWSRYTMQSLMLAVAAVLTIRGDISVGSMIASNVLIARALQPFDVIVHSWRQCVQATAAALEVQQVLAAPAVPARMVATSASTRPVELVLQSASVVVNQQPVLRDLSLHIQPGRVLCVMGSSGSGKSTLARLLVGAVPVAQGGYWLNGTAIEPALPPAALTHVGYLPQQVSLLEGTIAENVARFGALDAAEIIRACQRTGLHEAILRLPQGYDTRLDEHGLPLSGGQRQLLGLARAIYRDPMLLVLDEPNASLDEFGEVHLMQILQACKAMQCTVVVVSHRSGLLKITDDLLILKRGEAVHMGPRDAGIAYLNQYHAASHAAIPG